MISQLTERRWPNGLGMPGGEVLESSRFNVTLKCISYERIDFEAQSIAEEWLSVQSDSPFGNHNIDSLHSVC